ncbi:MAG: DNA starvation/stationary phase protection protein [Bacteroidota bacterium]
MEHLQEKNLEQVIANIRLLLANLHIHSQNLRNFHWNVTGQHFLELHKHLEELYEDTSKMIDEVAERLRALGTHARQSLQEYIAMAECEEQPQLQDPWSMIAAAKQSNEVMLKNMEAIVKAADKAEDFGSSDMFATYIGALEKQNWMLDALLQRP